MGDRFDASEARLLGADWNPRAYVFLTPGMAIYVPPGIAHHVAGLGPTFSMGAHLRRDGILLTHLNLARERPAVATASTNASDGVINPKVLQSLVLGDLAMASSWRRV
jgi:hypothetical protein